MKILEMLPELDAKALATVFANAQRLVEHGTPQQREQALDAMPLIESEQTRRAGLEPVKAKAKAAAKKPVKSRKKPVVETPSDDDDR